MTTMISRLAVCSTLLISLTVGQAVFAADKQQVSKSVGKQLQAAQKASQEKKWAECLSQTRAAQGVSGRTPYDDFIISELLGFCSIRTNDYSSAASALEAGLNSGFLPADQVGQRVRALAQIAYSTKNYDKAIEFGNRAIKGGYADGDIYTLVGQAMYLKGDNKGTLSFLSSYVNGLERNGSTPKEQTLQLILSSCIKLKDDACITSSFEKLVARYPKDEYWQNLVVSLLNSGANDRTMLHIYRLAAEVNAMRGSNYLEMAQLAIEVGLPGEAQSAMETAIGRKAITEPREVASGQRLLASAKSAATADRASLPKQDADAAKGKSGELDYKVGAAWLSYSQYPQAVTAISRGIAKGGLKNPAEAQLMLAIAQLRGGNKADALKSFKGVKGDATLERLASLWALRAQ